jgi:hypothetical protein
MEYNKIAELLTEAERHKLNKTARATVARLYNALPSDDMYHVSALTGQVKRHWYKNARRALQEYFGDDADIMADIIAGLSPQQSVRLNLIMALEIWGAWQRAGGHWMIKRLIKLHA